jgi:hypothetical protein
MIVSFLFAYFCREENDINYYVAVENGDDEFGDGTWDLPFATISIANTEARRKKEVVIWLQGPGTFIESVPSSISNSSNLGSRTVTVKVNGSSESRISNQVVGNVFIVNGSNLILDFLMVVYYYESLSIFDFAYIDEISCLVMNSCLLNQINDLDYTGGYLFSISGKAYFNNCSFTNFRIESSIWTLFNGEFKEFYFEDCEIVNISSPALVKANVAPIINSRNMVDRVLYMNNTRLENINVSGIEADGAGAGLIQFTGNNEINKSLLILDRCVLKDIVGISSTNGFIRVNNGFSVFCSY